MEFAIIFGFIAIVVGAVALLAILRGFVLSILWGWFVTETFGIRAISIPEAIGIALVAGMLISVPTNRRDDSNAALIGSIIAPFVALLIGWVVHQFM